jgi:signal transduction histidine kinase/GNAT superfamily N-acetyltransferase
MSADRTPVNRAPPGAPAQPHATSAKPAAGLYDAPINILIVDDEPKNLAVLETVLHNPGYRFVRATSADEALLALVSEPFALLILDIRMPGMTGFELAQIIKERKKTALVPIIFLTAYYSEDQHVLEGYGSGAVDYLHKPVNPSILRSKVAVFAELYRKTRDAALANRAMLDEVAERRRAEEQLRELNETLEQRVTDRTDALREADRRKDEFLAMLGHELRNPLSAITNAVHLITGGRGDPATVAWAHGLIDRQTGNLRRIVDDLLDVARLARGRIELRKQPVDVAQVIARAVEAVRSQVEQKNQEIDIALAAAERMRVDADSTRLEQCFVNLLVNAVKYTPEGGRIAISGQIAGVDVVVTVRDNGIGIAPDLLPHVFDLFTQGNRSLDRTQGGLGIGLSICRHLTELHGGTISARSAGTGHGAEFDVRLPALRDAGNDAAAPELPRVSAVSNGTTPRRVLVVDDNLDSVRSLAWLLKERGHAVCVAYDGPEALQAARDFKPDVLLLDLGLPGIDGFELARRLRADGFASALMIAISGYARDTDVKNAHAAGFDRHFAKPVDFPELLGALQLEPDHG